MKVKVLTYICIFICNYVMNKISFIFFEIKTFSFLMKGNLIYVI